MTPNCPRRRTPLLRPLLQALPLLACATAASAATFDTGDSPLQMRWDNTLKYSAAYRLHDANPVLLGNPNLDDGDRNFGRGLISSRVDVLSEFDINYAGQLGGRLSAAGWYDAVYNRGNANPGLGGGAVSNRLGAANTFADETVKQHGRKVEMLDAFVFGKATLGEGVALTARAGRHSLLWGESLFFGANAIAGGQQPVDAVKLLSVPGTQFKEAVRPVSQLSTQLQLSSTLALGAYYQLQWTPTVAPAVGSYFSDVDLVIRGAEQMLLLPPLAAPRQADVKPGNHGQGGVQLRWRLDETDFGFYAIRYHGKTPQLVSTLGAVTPPPNPVIAPVGFAHVYQPGILAYGASASHTFGAVNLATEVSLRRHQDLASTRGANLSLLGGPAAPGYAIGNTAHANVSMLAELSATPFWREAMLMGEVAWNRVLSITDNPDAADPNATRDAYALRVQLEPKYRQVLDGVDLGLPVGLGWAPRGSRSMALGPVGLPANNHGDLSIGLSGSYLEIWRFSLAWTHFFGAAGTLLDNANHYTYQQTLKDRDFVSLAFFRSF